MRFLEKRAPCAKAVYWFLNKIVIFSLNFQNPSYVNCWRELITHSTKLRHIIISLQIILIDYFPIYLNKTFFLNPLNCFFFKFKVIFNTIPINRVDTGQTQILQYPRNREFEFGTTSARTNQHLPVAAVACGTERTTVARRLPLGSVACRHAALDRTNLRPTMFPTRGRLQLAEYKTIIFRKKVLF